MPDMNGHPIDHVVVLMLENRGFDHVMGYLYAQAHPPLHSIPNGPYTIDWWQPNQALPTFLGLDGAALPPNTYSVNGRIVLSSGRS